MTPKDNVSHHQKRNHLLGHFAGQIEKAPLELDDKYCLLEHFEDLIDYIMNLDDQKVEEYLKYKQQQPIYPYLFFSFMVGFIVTSLITLMAVLLFF